MLGAGRSARAPSEGTLPCSPGCEPALADPSHRMSSATEALSGTPYALRVKLGSVASPVSPVFLALPPTPPESRARALWLYMSVPDRCPLTCALRVPSSVLPVTREAAPVTLLGWGYLRSRKPRLRKAQCFHRSCSCSWWFGRDSAQAGRTPRPSVWLEAVPGTRPTGLILQAPWPTRGATSWLPVVTANPHGHVWEV